MLLREFFDVHFAPVKLALACTQTVYQYGLNMQRFDEFLGKSATLSDLTDQNIGQACQWLMRKKQLSISSASKLRENLCTLWKFAFAKQMVQSLPVIPHIREPRRIPRAWSREELTTLWQYLSKLPGVIGDIPENIWYQSLVAVLWDTGERIGAVWQVAWPQVDLDGGWMTVRAEQRKGRKSDRLYKLRPETIALLRQIQQTHGRVWPWPFCETYLWQRWKQLLRRAGLPDGREFAFHCFRKSVGSHIAAAGGNAQQALDHASQETTTLIYLDPRIVKPPQPSDLLFRLGDAG